MQKNLLDILLAFVRLFFPKICYGCNTELDFFEEIICTKCLVEMPLTNFHRLDPNPLNEKFESQLTVQHITALLYFQKEGIVANLIHQFKYLGILEIGIFLGSWLGWQLHENPKFKTVDFIVPVPLHPKREKKRGFNQALIIAKQVSAIIKVPLLEKGLVRSKNTKQLAHLGIDDRRIEIQNAFTVHPTLKKEPKHFLLIDDVITTGATLTACSQSLIKYTTGKISIAALAFRN